MSEEFPQNQVDLSPLPESQPKDAVLVRGAFYEHWNGTLYHAVSTSKEDGGYRLMSLIEGNRWADDNTLDLNTFTRLESGRVITITVE